MYALEVMGLAVALGCDAFAVGLGVGARHAAPRQVFRLAFHFGLFQFLMPLAGWGLGGGVMRVAAQWGPWLAFAVLTGLGLKMAWDGISGNEPEPGRGDPTKGFSLVALSIATSIDALGVGFSLGLVGGAIWWASVVIGLTASAMTVTAMFLARRLSAGLGRVMDVLGGLILAAIGLKILFS